MYIKMFKNYIRKNKLVSIATCLFMIISAVFIGLTVLLSVSLLGAIDNLMTEAKTCDFLQMHSGDIDEVQLREFADSRDDVEDMLIANFLNIENSSITLNGISLADSTQDNGLCIQNENFDHLLGTKSCTRQRERYMCPSVIRVNMILNRDRKCGSEICLLPSQVF